MQALLKTHSVTIRRGDSDVASGLNLSAGPGDAVLLVGANGSGKTSILRALAGLLETDSGNIERNADFHFISAQELPGSTQTPRDYLRTQAALQNVAFNPAADPFAIHDKLDIPLHRLSTGWRQRVKLSRLHLFTRPIWLLDEPSDGLDAQGLTLLLAMLAAHRAQGGAAIIATHQPDAWPRDARRIQVGAA